MTNKTKLAALRDYFVEGGSTEEADVMEFLDTTSTEVVDEYAAALKKKYPEDFPSDEVAAIAAVNYPSRDDMKNLREAVPTTFFLKSDGLLKELEVLKQKDGRTIFEIKEPKDLVTILIKGQPVEVDLIKLRKMDSSESVHGIAVGLLLGLAELAKG